MPRKEKKEKICFFLEEIEKDKYDIEEDEMDIDLDLEADEADEEDEEELEPMETDKKKVKVEIEDEDEEGEEEESEDESETDEEEDEDEIEESATTVGGRTMDLGDLDRIISALGSDPISGVADLIDLVGNKISDLLNLGGASKDKVESALEQMKKAQALRKAGTKRRLDTYQKA